MRRLLPLVLLALVLVSSSPAVAATSLESRIEAATGIVRPVDAALQARAAIRAVEVQTDFSHCCLASNEAEIIARNSGFDDPEAQLVASWLASPDHAAILGNPDWHNIGCAVALSGARTYGVCLFAAAAAPPNSMPNTALPS